MKQLKTTLIALPILGALVPTDVFAESVTREQCEQAVSALGYSTDGYEFRDRFLSDKHVFDGEVECYGREDDINITANGEKVAEDGYFGRTALSARDAAIQLKRSKADDLRKARDAAIDVAKTQYEASLAELDAETELALRDIRDGGMPEFVAIAMKKKEAAKALEEEREQKELEAERLAKEADRQRGFHCLSGWSGANPSVIEQVKSMLNDPDSFEHVETKVAPVQNAQHRFQMKYRAKNGFGGTVTEVATGTYGHNDCKSVIVKALQ